MLEASDIQGIVLRGYKELPFARFVLLSFVEPARVRAWLRDLPIRAATLRPSDQAVNVAFTHAGLRALMGDTLPPDDAFARELTEGMTGSHQRRRALGDQLDQAPEHWLWGGATPDVEDRSGPWLVRGQAERLHGVLLLYVASEGELATLEREHLGAAAGAHGLAVHRLETRTLSDVEDTSRALFREHFGFRDGVAQPVIDGDPTRESAPAPGTPRDTAYGNTIPAGEVLFGHPDAYGQLPEGAGEPELALHGSFLVMRQLEQDVLGFWTAVVEHARELRLDPIAFAAKLVGRWPSGAPLVVSPERDVRGLERHDAFGYRELDPNGLRCPFGSHIRRCNPRDDLDDSAEASLRLTKLHRLVRRGRPYGKPIAEPFDPASFLPRLPELIANPPPGGPRGLQFLCFNTNLSRQFEFVQATWVNNPRFSEGREAPDPLLGPGGAFELPSVPLARRVEDLPRFVTTRGGAYFFMPGLRALARIAHD